MGALSIFIFPCLFAAFARWLPSIAFLSLFDKGVRATLFWRSWAWACFAAPVGGFLFLTPWLQLWRVARPESWPTSVQFAFMSVPYLLVCLVFDWRLAHRTLCPCNPIEERRVALWLWTAHLLNCVWVIGLMLAAVAVLSSAPLSDFD